MHETKHLKSRKKRNTRAVRQRMTVLLVSLFLTVFVSIGAVLAYLFTKTDSVENTFTPADVSCDVEENFDGTTKTDVNIKNTGEVEAYIRATVIVTWVADEGGVVYATKPVEGEDYIITYSDGADWIKDANDFWYYISPVGVGESTTDLIEKCIAAEGKTPEGYHLSVEIVASAIQSSPETVVETQWGVTVENYLITAVPSAN
ncbi:MAG: hypothetical protein IJ439_04535 [Tyzzerella sp.]|nr:hypothetical protein [Tyzzerella sp.]